MPNLSSLIKSIRDIMREDRGLSGDGQRIEQLAWMLFLKIMDDKDQEQEILHDDYVSPVPSEFQWRNWAAPEHSGLRASPGTSCSSSLTSGCSRRCGTYLRTTPARSWCGRCSRATTTT